MQYSILVFNRENLGTIAEDLLINEITESNYETLSRQYGLETSMIGPALSNLEVIRAKNDHSPFFVVRYGKSHTRTVVVNQWDTRSNEGRKFLHKVIHEIALESLSGRLCDTNWVVEIGLSPVQLKNMGLLLAYEIARWAAERGDGVVYGLDGGWYQLNQHKAFMPINSSRK